MVPSRKLTWKPKKGPIKIIALLKEGYMGFHVGLGEWKVFEAPRRGLSGFEYEKGEAIA